MRRFVRAVTQRWGDVSNILTVATPVGRLGLVDVDGAITRLLWNAADQGEASAVLVEARRQVAAYFAGKLQKFDLPLHIAGSEFLRDVCAVMSAIPLGETKTYGDIAEQLGASAQAVGNACGGNPIPVIIPCHRVLGATSLGGFSGVGGVDTKVALLRHEGAAGLLI